MNNNRVIEFLKQPAGPLPVWGWGVAIIVGYFAISRLTGGSAGASGSPVSGGPKTPSQNKHGQNPHGKHQNPKGQPNFQQLQSIGGY